MAEDSEFPTSPASPRWIITPPAHYSPLPAADIANPVANALAAAQMYAKITSGYRSPREQATLEKLRRRRFARRGLVPPPAFGLSHLRGHVVHDSIAFRVPPPPDAPIADDFRAMGRAVAEVRWRWSWPGPRAGARPWDQEADG